MKNPPARHWQAASFIAGVLIGLSIVAPILTLTGGQCDSVGDAHPGWLCIALVLGVALQAAAIAKSPREIVLPLIGITAAERRTRLARSI